MFLLNRLAISAAPKAVIKFTSHYVPIKSTFLFIVLFLPIYLHPIMFLLNRLLADVIVGNIIAFTSHYVPIKSSYHHCNYQQN